MFGLGLWHNEANCTIIWPKLVPCPLRVRNTVQQKQSSARSSTDIFVMDASFVKRNAKGIWELSIPKESSCGIDLINSFVADLTPKTAIKKIEGWLQQPFVMTKNDIVIGIMAPKMDAFAVLLYDYRTWSPASVAEMLGERKTWKTVPPVFVDCW